MTNFILKATVLTAMLATSLAATSFEVAKGEIVSAGSQVEQVAEIDASGNTARVVVVVKQTPYAATEHSPACASTHAGFSVFGFNVANSSLSECVRVCIKPPAGMEINSSAGVTGSTDHAWSQVFSPEWYPDTKIMCAFVKNWSAHQVAVGVLVVGICPLGAGCANGGLPAKAPAPVATPSARSEYRPERISSARSRGLSD